MAVRQLYPVLQFLRGLADPGPSREIPDSSLLERFVQNRDEEVFRTLLLRHGPLVFGVCRRLLGNGPDAEDAFQATFLVLAHRAGSISAGFTKRT